MSNTAPEGHLSEYPSCACADCLEKAQGRQMKLNPPCWVERCPVCGHKTTVYDPATFGRPRLENFQPPAQG